MTLLTLTARTTSHAAGGGLGWLVLLGLAAALVYLAACVLWPFKRCRWCTGSGRSRSPSGKAWRDCRHCDGTGTTLRAGRRLTNRLHDIHARGTRPDRGTTTTRSWKDTQK